VIYAPPEVYLPYGQPAVLDCHFRANPPLKNLRWEKDGLLFDSYNVPGVFYKMNGSLFFAKVDENHAGSYTCTPYNDLGTDGPSPVISVIVLRPPIFSVTPKAIYIQKLGEAAELPCEAIDRDGNNRPSIVWSRVSPYCRLCPYCPYCPYGHCHLGLPKMANSSCRMVMPKGERMQFHLIAFLIMHTGSST